MAVCLKVNDALVGNNVNRLMPVVADFTNGQLRMENEAVSAASFACYKPKNESDRKGYKHLLVGDVGKLKFVGQRQKTDLHCRYYLGVFDEDNGTVEIQTARLFRLQPKIIEDLNYDSKSIDTTDDDKTYLQKSDNLVEAFGSARQKRAMVSRLKNIVDTKVTSGRVGEIALQMSPQLASPVLPASESVSLPPVNQNATVVNDLYDIKALIGQDTLLALQTPASELANTDRATINDWKEKSVYPEYIINHLLVLPLENSLRQERCCYLLYLHFLMLFFKLTFKDIRKRDVLSEVPEDIRSKILNEFSVTTGGKRYVPKRLKDKALCYLLVIALIIDEYSLDCSALMRDLKLGLARLSFHLKAIGCKVKCKTQRKRKVDGKDFVVSEAVAIAQLTLPEKEEEILKE